MRSIPTPWGPFLDFPDTIVGRTLAEGRFWDAHLRPAMLEAATTAGDGIALDIGAYNGFHTAYLAQHYRWVLAVEPQPESYQLLVANTRHLPNVLTYLCAGYSRAVNLGPAEGAACGWDPSDVRNAPSVPLVPQERGAIPGVPLDVLIPPERRVAFVKIDAQGCDLQVLRGLSATIARCRPLIVFEWEEAYALWHGDRWADVERWAAEAGYRVERITPDFWDYVARPR